MAETPITGVVVMAFGPQPMDIFSQAEKVCGPDAVLDTGVARMAGAAVAVGPAAALDQLRARLEAHSLNAQREATPGLPDAAVHWLAAGERGTSSETIFTHLTGVNALGNDRADHPHDPDDLDRCLALLNQVPELRAGFGRMAEVSPEWAALVKHWAEIEQSHLDEVGLGWTKAKSAPRTYALMRKVIEQAGGGLT